MLTIISKQSTLPLRLIEGSCHVHPFNFSELLQALSWSFAGADGNRIERLQRAGRREGGAVAPGFGGNGALRGGIARAKLCRHHQAADRDRHGFSRPWQGRKKPAG